MRINPENVDSCSGTGNPFRNRVFQADQPLTRKNFCGVGINEDPREKGRGGIRVKRMLVAGVGLCAFLSLGFKNAGPSASVVSADGEAAPIIVASDAPPNTLGAVDELARLIEASSGKRPAILKGAPSPLPSTAIWIGRHKEMERVMPGTNFELSKPEETLIVSSGGHVAILGNDKVVDDLQVASGTANAIYTFIQKDLGVRWLWPGTSGEVVPEKKTISIPPGETRYAPAFLQRDLFTGEKGWSPNLKDWCIRQRLYFDSLNVPRGHSFYEWWDRYHETHPEYFALQPDGTRSGYPQPRRAKVSEGEPAVWKQWLENVAVEFQADPMTRVFGASQNDSSNSGICMDPRSVAWDHPEGPLQKYIWEGKVDNYVAMSDRMVRFLNTLGGLLEKRFPGENLQVMGMAYGPSKPGPREAIPAANVVIGYVGQFPTAGDAQRKLEKEQFAEWAKKSHTMVFRPNLFYYSGGWHGLPVITPRLVEDDFCFLAENNCRGILVDGVPLHWGTQGLQYYVMAQLMWDPFQKADAMVEEFCRLGFGPAAETMKTYFGLMEKAQMATLNHAEWLAGMGVVKNILSETILPGAYHEKMLDEADRLITRAGEQLAKSPPIYRERLELVARAQEYTRMMMKTLLAMNEVRRSGGKNYQAVEEAVRLVNAREALFANEDKTASLGSRPPAVNSHRIRTTWIESRGFQDWMGPVKEDFLLAAQQAKKSGASPKLPLPANGQEPAGASLGLAHPKTLRWTGNAADMSWQNKNNWEGLAESGSWVPVSAPPDESTRVLLGDLPGKPGLQILRIGRDTTVESISIIAASPKASYRIESRPDDTGGIDADSARLYALTLTGEKPISQKPQTCAAANFDLEVRFANPAAKVENLSNSKAEIILRQQTNAKPTTPGAKAPDASKEPEKPAAEVPPPSFLGKGPVVLFGGSTVAPRGKTKIFAQCLEQYFSENGWDIPIINAGAPGNTTTRARTRLEKDVLCHNPTCVFIMFGINDSAVDVYKNPPATEPRVPLEEYLSNLQVIIEQIKARGGEVVLMTPQRLAWTPTLKELYGKPPYHPEDPDGMNVLLDGYAEGLRQLAAKNGIRLVDVQKAWKTFENETGRPAATLLQDGMHPNDNGHRLIADLLIAKINE